VKGFELNAWAGGIDISTSLYSKHNGDETWRYVMKTFIASAIFFFLVKWPIGTQEVTHQWFDYFADFVLIFGFIFCLLEDIWRHNREED
jgi:hypothetical protein